MVSAPHLAQLVGAARDILHLILDVGTGRRARSLFVSYLRNIISLLESSLPSLSEDDAEIVRNLQSRLRDTLDKMTSHNRPLLYHLRYVLKSDEDLIAETRREIEDTLRLIEASDNIHRDYCSNNSQLTDLVALQVRTMVSINRDLGRLMATISADDPYGAAPATLGVSRSHTIARSNRVCSCGSKTWIPNATDHGYPLGAGCASRDNGGLGITLLATYRKVERHRLLVQQDPIHIYCLANSLNEMAKLLQSVGRPDEALAYSQEAVDLYGSLIHDGAPTLGPWTEPEDFRALEY
ncbi:unnamed protein product [Rhizoctonia solani]|uniref:Uncharacterized protein n=1 Tax=Rhizoctonia solani TaxID=456999 RepID=A0A8H2Y292_9AGAM|nr:unnamed protein product [Rhizoctonia solani]